MSLLPVKVLRYEIDWLKYLGVSLLLVLNAQPTGSIWGAPKGMKLIYFSTCGTECPFSLCRS